MVVMYRLVNIWLVWPRVISEHFYYLENVTRDSFNLIVRAKYVGTAPINTKLKLITRTWLDVLEDVPTTHSLCTSKAALLTLSYWYDRL